jgi:hypothetical protein
LPHRRAVRACYQALEYDLLVFGELKFHRSENQDEMCHELRVCKETNIGREAVGKRIQIPDSQLQGSDTRWMIGSIGMID